MGRFIGTLHKLADGGPTKKGNWSIMMNYLEGHCVGSREEDKSPPFDSPLPPRTVASESLMQELLDGQGPKSEDTPLRILCKQQQSQQQKGATASTPSTASHSTSSGGGGAYPCPWQIMGAVCHLAPEAARMADHRDRLPIHWLCRTRSSSSSDDAEKCIRILISAYPASMIHRDDAGRTPLHYLLWFYAKTRTTKLVDFCLKELDPSSFVGIRQMPSSPTKSCFKTMNTTNGDIVKNHPLPEIPQITASKQQKQRHHVDAHYIPASAAIIHDARHGCLPLHYACMEGASKEVIRLLLLHYPLSRAKTDRWGRTALHWYLGAGTNFGSPGQKHHQHHVSGEAPDPQCKPWHQQYLSTNVVHLLLNSTVARSQDTLMQRTPLHWACALLGRYHFQKQKQSSSGACLSMKGIQFLLDTYMEALIKVDGQGNTPLMVLLDTVAQLQSYEYERLQRNGISRQDLNLLEGGGSKSSAWNGAFYPPKELMQLLLKSPEAHAEERRKFVSPKNPATERPVTAAMVEDAEGRLPLHMTLATACNAEIVQLIVQHHPTALVHTTDDEQQTPLHMAFSYSPYTTPLLKVDVIQILLQAYVTSRHGTFVDGKLALKMEDAHGTYPLHYACWNGACMNVLQFIMNRYPKAACFASGTGELPIHYLLKKQKRKVGHGKSNNIDKDRSLNLWDAAMSCTSNNDGTDIPTLLGISMGWTSTHSTTFYQRACLQILGQKIEALIGIMVQDCMSRSNSSNVISSSSSFGGGGNNATTTTKSSTLDICSREDGWIALHMAIAFDALDYKSLYRLLSACTSTTRTMLTTTKGHEYSALDLHEMRRRVGNAATTTPTNANNSNNKNTSHWMQIRELLYAFGPPILTKNYNFNNSPSSSTSEDLLEQCVKLIREEAILATKEKFHLQQHDQITQAPTSFHAKQIWDISIEDASNPNLLLLVDTLSNVEAPTIDRASRPQTTRNSSPNKMDGKTPKRRNLSSSNNHSNNNTPKSTPQQQQRKTFSLSNSPDEDVRRRRRHDENGNKRSIYDDDEDDFGGYTVDDDDEYLLDDDEDDEFFDQVDDEDEEYFPEQDSYDDDYDYKKYDVPPKQFYTKPDGTLEESIEIDDYHTDNENNNNAHDADEMNHSPTLSTLLSSSSNLMVSTTTIIPKTPPPFLSEVAMRIWCLFVLYTHKEYPYSNFARQVDAILDDLEFDVSSKLVSLQMPDYVLQEYKEYTMMMNQHETTSITSPFCLREQANNYCKQVIHGVFYFVGRYEFKNSSNDHNNNTLLLHRSNDGETVLVRAQEYMIQTLATPYESMAKPGDVEATIWETGIIPKPEPKFSGSNYTIKTRPICIKFLKNQQAYEREVSCRINMNVDVVDKYHIQEIDQQQNEDESTTMMMSKDRVAVLPLINHYCANYDNDDDKKVRSANRRYRKDIHDERFNQLELGGTGGGSRSRRHTMISISDYPYAIVVPYQENSTLFDHFLHHGQMSMDEIRDIALHLGRTIQKFHQHGYILGNLLLDKISFMSTTANDDDDDDYDGSSCWVLTDLSSTCKQGTTSSDNNKIGAVAPNGSANFSTSTFPPELFVKLNPGELKMYCDYWDTVVSTIDGVESLDRDVVGPKMDPSTNETYVAKCFYHMDHHQQKQLPPLPYSPVPARETLDLWSFGQLLFTLCSSGHPLFPTNLKTGHLLNYGETARWNIETAKSMIYRHVKDPLAQDLLFHILSSDRSHNLEMETILSHPFFFVGMENNNQESNDDDDDDMTKITQRIISKRNAESIIYRRNEDTIHYQQAQGEWLSTRSEKMISWDLEFQMKMYLSPSNLIRLEQQATFSAANDNAIRISEIPISMLVLPYKLTRNKAGKLTPATKKDVERAERMGVQLLALSKACRYATLMEQIVTGTQDENHTWSTSEISAAMALSSNDFSDLEKEMSHLAAREVERFRDNPLLTARRLVQERVKDLQACYIGEEKQKAYLYLVDEYAGVPILESPYPYETDKNVPELVQNVLPFMYLCTMYVRGVKKSVAGLVQLIFEAAYPHTPPSWKSASSGLVHDLNEESMRGQLFTLRRAIAESMGIRRVSNTTQDELQFLQSYLHQFDPTHGYAKLRRATSSNNDNSSSLWTCHVEQLHYEASNHSSLPKAYHDYMKNQELMKSQSKRIAELEQKVEQLSFRHEYNLKGTTDDDDISDTTERRKNE